MEMPKPTDFHRKLEHMTGLWVGEERIAPSPLDPNGGTAKARVHNRVALNGFAVLQDYEQERNGSIVMRAHGVFRWDAARKEYVLHWFDMEGKPPVEFRGNFEGRELRMIAQHPQGFNRATFVFDGNGEYLYTLEVSRDSRQWQKFLEGRYTKKG